MKTNMSNLDRWIRVLLAIGLAVLVFTDYITGGWAIVALALAAIFLVTSMVRFCPLYLPFKISTYRKKTA
ncbi:MAG: DUF2892 domain-containing protein [Flavobacteriia bacterium]|nr:DUF2892 domain-containing protein [Flavobacteriia bacterium]